MGARSVVGVAVVLVIVAAAVVTAVAPGVAVVAPRGTSVDRVDCVMILKWRREGVCVIAEVGDGRWVDGLFGSRGIYSVDAVDAVGCLKAAVSIKILVCRFG